MSNARVPSAKPSRSAWLSLGIDVGGTKKGFHLVMLNRQRQIAGSPRVVHAQSEITQYIQDHKPAVVAIDAPCGWSDAKSRLAERELARRGIHSHCTPTRKRARESSFYHWMFAGEKAVQAASDLRPLFTGGRSVNGRSFEVFPTATVQILKKEARPKSVSKTAWRRGLLDELGIEQASLSNLDYVDAALCALTGLFALEGNFPTFGQAGEGMLIAPADR